MILPYLGAYGGGASSPKSMQIGSVGRLLINYFLVLNYFQNWLLVCAEGDGVVLVV
jgi:hypothetical protein